MKDVQCNNVRGFTLIEVLVALAMFALIAVAVGDLVIRSLRSNDVIWEQLETQHDGRAVLEQVVDDVRRAEPSSIGSYPIADATSSTLTFFANVDSDIGRERVRFFLDGTDVKKGVVQPSGNPINYSGEESIIVVATDVVNTSSNIPLFEYYDESYPVTTTPLTVPDELTDIRAVRVQLEIDSDPNASPVALHVETVVSVRNLKSN